MNVPLISVIIPTYNRCEMLGGALESLLRQKTDDAFSYEIIVIDNASTDDTERVVEQVAAQAPIPVRYFYHAIPGPAPARNRGLAESHGDWIAFFDDDELATPDWLAELYRAALETKAPVIGGAMHLDLPQETLDRLGRYVRHTSFREIDYYPTIHPYTDKRLPGTNNALVARRVFDGTGEFDTTKVCGGSDSDFFIRARAAGNEMMYTPHAVVRHRVAPNRLTREHLRWDAGQGCSAFAGLDYKFKGPLVLLIVCAARIGHALLVVVPRLAWGWIRQDPGEVLGQRVRLWRTEGYVRKTLAILAPSWFPQERYFANMEFRKGRTIGQPTTQMETAS